MGNYKSVSEVMREISDNSEIAAGNWKVAVCLGHSDKYDHQVFLLYIESCLIEGASLFVTQEDFNLQFSKKVKPFLGKTGLVYSDTERRFKETIEVIYKKKKCINDCNIDELVGSVIPDEVVKGYYNNLCVFVNNNLDLFGERKDKTSDDEEINYYNPKIHSGAFLRDSMYMEKYKCSDNSPALALKIEQFKILCDIDLNRYQVKDVVQAFISRGYILTGGSATIDKDLTLSKGNQERCYVLDLSR